MTKRILQYGFTAVLTVVFLYATFRGADLHQIIASLEGVNYWWILLMVAVLVFSDYLRGIRWGYMLKPVKEKMAGVNLFSSVMIGYLLNNVLPRAGEISRAYALARLESVSVSSVLAATVAERVLDVITLLLLLLLLPFVYAGPLREVFPWLAEAEIIGVIGSVIAIGGVLVVVLKREMAQRWLQRLFNLLPEKIGKRLSGIADRFLDGLMFFRRPSTFIPILLYTIPIWGLYVVMNYAGFLAFGLPLDLAAAQVVLTIATIGVAIPTPAGTGTYHFFVVAALFGLFAISRETALAFATVVHGALFVGTSLVGVGFFLKDQKKLAGFWKRNDSITPQTATPSDV